MDESKVEGLRQIHLDLARFLRESHQELHGVALVVGALRKTIEGDPDLAGKYRKNLQDLQAGVSEKNRLAQGVALDLLRRLEDW